MRTIAYATGEQLNVRMFVTLTVDTTLPVMVYISHGRNVVL